MSSALTGLSASAQRAKGSFQTFEGHWFNVFDPDPELINLTDIAQALSNLCRFGGHCRKFYSVAQHSVLVSSFLHPKFCKLGLLHDATEAYLLDVPRPVKHSPEFKIYRDIEDALAKVIASKFGLEYPYPEAVKKADNLALAVEVNNLKRPDSEYWGPWLSDTWVEHPTLRNLILDPLSPEAAFDYFKSALLRSGLLV